LISLALLASAVSANAKVESYKYASELPLSSKYSVKVDGKKVSVLQTAEPDFAIFGTDKEVTVQITCLAATPDSVYVRPLAKNYEYSLKGNVVTVRLKPGDRVSVEPDASQEKPLFIFVNGLTAKEAKLAAKDTNTIFFAAGKVHKAGKVKLSQGKTLYIEGGAVVDGYIDHSDTCSNITIAGAGIFDARGFARPNNAKNAIKIADVDSLRVRDITVLNADYWTTYFIRCDHSDFRNMHVIATASGNKYGHENDAFNIVGCQHVNIEGCFTYAHDDAYCIKTSAGKIFRECFDVHYNDCVGWNITSGNSFEIGYSVRADVHDVWYKNLYAIHSGAKPARFRRAGIAIHNGGGGHLYNIHYENVYIEDPLEQIISFNTFVTPYKTYKWYPGTISDVTVKNIHCWKYAPCGSEIKGLDEEHLTKNVVIEDFYIAGKKVTTLQEADIRRTQFTENIIIK